MDATERMPECPVPNEQNDARRPEDVHDAEPEWPHEGEDHPDRQAQQRREQSTGRVRAFRC